MQTRLSTDNPHATNRYGFAWECVPERAGTHLDFGCHEGDFLATLKRKGIDRLIGCDANASAIEAARGRFADAEFHHVPAGRGLPFDDSSIDSATLLDVLEHVADQQFVLGELHRVLRPGGRLVVTVPREHAFSFLDLGNFKFMFPRLHRAYVVSRHGVDFYRSRYEANADGLIGDIAAEKAWHEHFSQARLGRLLRSSGFGQMVWDGAGLFCRPLGLLNSMARKLRLPNGIIEGLARRDRAAFRSCHLFVCAQAE